MSKQQQFIKQIKALKASKGFTVTTEADRQSVCRAAAELKRYGVIEFDVVTKREGDAFKVAAI
jgi:hypothetical protein